MGGEDSMAKTVLKILCVQIFCLAAIAQDKDPFEEWLESFMPTETVNSNTCIVDVTLPIVRHDSSSAEHQVLVHYLQDGQKLLKPYPEPVVLPAGSENWGTFHLDAVKQYKSHPGCVARSCDKVRSVVDKFRHFFDHDDSSVVD
jgi:hypothetical protein